MLFYCSRIALGLDAAITRESEDNVLQWIAQIDLVSYGNGISDEKFIQSAVARTKLIMLLSNQMYIKLLSFFRRSYLH